MCDHGIATAYVNGQHWTYTFTIEDRASGNELLGKRFKTGNDSAMIGADQLKFEWSGDDLKVDYSKNQFLKAKIGGNVQQWKWWTGNDQLQACEWRRIE